MKLRIHGRSIRLRLSKTEVLRLREVGRVEDAVVFSPTRSLTYTLVAADVPAATATFEDLCIVVSLPRELAYAWVGGEEIGLEAQQDTGPGGPLSIVVEKDFARLSRRNADDDTDAFKNPRAR